MVVYQPQSPDPKTALILKKEIQQLSYFKVIILLSRILKTVIMYHSASEHLQQETKNNPEQTKSTSRMLLLLFISGHGTSP